MYCCTYSADDFCSSVEEYTERGEDKLAVDGEEHKWVEEGEMVS